MSSNAIFAKRILCLLASLSASLIVWTRGPSANEHFIANRAA
jgi:hypothetical protein